VIRAGEAEDIFETYQKVLSMKLGAKLISTEDMWKAMEEFQTNRARPVTVEWPASRGTVYVEPAENGRRRFDLLHTERVQAPGSRILQYLGAIVFACGFIGLFIEWRLRRLKTKRR
jgi:hypothetical protein